MITYTAAHAMAFRAGVATTTKTAESLLRAIDRGDISVDQALVLLGKPDMQGNEFTVLHAGYRNALADSCLEADWTLADKIINAHGYGTAPDDAVKHYLASVTTATNK